MFLTMSKTGKYTNIFSIGQPLNYFYSIKQTKNLKDHQNNIQATGYTHTHTHTYTHTFSLKNSNSKKQTSTIMRHSYTVSAMAFSPILQVGSNRTEITSYEIFPNMKFKFWKEKSMLFQKAKSVNTRVFFFLPYVLL